MSHGFSPWVISAESLPVEVIRQDLAEREGINVCRSQDIPKKYFVSAQQVTARDP